MDISSTLNQNCCFKLAYSVLQFALFVLSTQPQIIAAEENTLRNKGDCLPGWLTGGKSAHQMISTSISGLESMLTAPLQTKRMFSGKTSPWSGGFVKHFDNRGRETAMKTHPQWRVWTINTHYYHNNVLQCIKPYTCPKPNDRQAGPALFPNFGVNTNTPIQLQ